MPCADMLRQRQAGLAVMLTDEAAFVAKAELYEAGIADDDALQAQQLIAVKRLATGFADGTAPALDAVWGGRSPSIA